MQQLKLFRSESDNGSWIGQDPAGSLVQWPRKPRGYAERTPFVGRRRGLVAVDPRLATRTGWPGVPRGPIPRDGSTSRRQLVIRLSDAESPRWERAAGKEPIAAWARAIVNAAIDAAGVACRS